MAAAALAGAAVPTGLLGRLAAHEPAVFACQHGPTSDTAVTALKWLALVAMVLDHTDHLLFRGQLGLQMSIGRLALPLFLFVLAHNLVARPSFQARPERFGLLGPFKPLLGRLLTAGLMAQVPVYALMDRMLPLNIMFTLALCVLGFASAQYAAGRSLDGGSDTNLQVASSPVSFERRCVVGGGGLVAVVLLSVLVDYPWMALIAFAGCCVYARRPGPATVGVMCLGVAALYPSAMTLAALGAVPLIVLLRWLCSPLAAPAGVRARATALLSRLPRASRFFYLAYPAHLVLILMVTLALRSTA